MWDFPDNPLYLSQASKMFSDSSWEKVVRLPRSFSTLDGGKYFVRNLFAISSHVAIVFLGKELNHVFALSVKKKEKKFQLYYLLGHTIYPLYVTYL